MFKLMKTRETPRRVIWLALLVGLAAPGLVLLGALGSKAGWFSWETGFVTLTIGWAPTVAIAGIVLGLLAVLMAMVLRSKAMWAAALLALILPAATLGAMAAFKNKAKSVPPIHDVSTDWADPPMFSATIMAARGADANPVERDPRAPEKAKNPRWAGRRVAEINAETCPGAKPVGRMVDAAEARRVLEDQGVVVVGSAPFRVEGTHESAWFGFEDDVIVRIRPGRTDVRSVSRVGASDIGANCERVTKIVRALSAGA